MHRGFACCGAKYFRNMAMDFISRKSLGYNCGARWSSLVARWAHNPKVGGSNPSRATRTPKASFSAGFFVVAANSPPSLQAARHSIRACRGCAIKVAAAKIIRKSARLQKCHPISRYNCGARWSSLVARWAHNPKVGGSNPSRATRTSKASFSAGFFVPAIPQSAGHIGRLSRCQRHAFFNWHTAASGTGSP